MMIPMKLVAIMPARNEAWILGLSLRAALMWCDSVVLLLHACTDESLEIAAAVAREHVGRVQIIEDHNALWSEMAHRQRLLDCARLLNATHIALVDADEVLSGNLLAPIRKQVEGIPSGACLECRMPQLWGSLDNYAVDVPSSHGGLSANWGHSVTTVAFADNPALKWHAANGYDHHHREPYGSRRGLRMSQDGGLMHLQFANPSRLRAKHALYKMTERIRWPQKSVAEIDALYNLAIKPSKETTQPVPAAWWEPYSHLLGHVDMASAPWQTSQCEWLALEHGPDTFQGLDLFGVI